MEKYFYLENRNSSYIEYVGLADLKECKNTFKFTLSDGNIRYLKKSKRPIIVQKDNIDAAKAEIQKHITEEIEEYCKTTLTKLIKWEIINYPDTKISGIWMFGIKVIKFFNEDYHDIPISTENPFSIPNNSTPRYPSDLISESSIKNIVDKYLKLVFNYPSVFKISSGTYGYYFLNTPPEDRIMLRENNSFEILNTDLASGYLTFQIVERNIWYGSKNTVTISEFLSHYSLQNILDRFNEKFLKISSESDGVFIKRGNGSNRTKENITIAIFSIKDGVYQDNSQSEYFYGALEELRKKKSNIHIVLPLTELHTTKDVLLNCLRYTRTDIWLEFKYTKLWLFNFSSESADNAKAILDTIKKQVDSSTWAAIELANEV